MGLPFPFLKAVFSRRRCCAASLVDIQLRGFLPCLPAHISVLCKLRLIFSSCVPSSHLSTFSDSSLTQGHTTHGAASTDSVSWEVQVERKDCVWAISYIWSNCIVPSYFTQGLDTQMKYTSHMTFYPETTSSSNSSRSKEMFTA